MEATTDVQSQEITSLQYSPEDKEYDSCYYVIGNKDFEYTDGAQVYLKFTYIKPGITLYLRASSDVQNTTTVDIEGLPANQQPQADVTYSIDQGAKFIVTAVPMKDSEETGFEFQYYTDGKAYDQLLMYYHKFFKQNEQGEMLLYIAAGCAVLFVCIIICCICCCIRKCCQPKNKVEDTAAQGQYSEMAQLARNKAAGQENAMSATEGAGVELELESIHGSNDGDITGQGDNPTVLKQTKAQREEEMRKAYANPFK